MWCSRHSSTCWTERWRGELGYRVLRRRVPGEPLPSPGWGEMLLCAVVLMKSVRKALRGKDMLSLL